nr:probable multidrug resistance-associated protein lethal(2)03659 [Leptinotarsa decemlineata]
MMWVFYLKVVIVMAGMLFSSIGLYILIMSLSWFGYAPETELIFYILSIFKDLNHVLGIIIPWGLAKAAEVYASIIRINKVLLAEELHQKYGSDEPTDKPLVEVKDVTVHIKDVKILRNVSFGTRTGLTIVTGAVGSGKSSLLKTILQDYPLSTGSLYTHGRISYASQDPWLFPSSIKQNILFGEKFNEKRYAEVVRVCALEYDFSFFEKRDETIVTDRGLNLSKGQQARVNLARAVYKESEIYLLDDSLTALDAHVQDHIFRECIQTFLKDKICILVTQTASQIEKVDNVVMMEDGHIKYHGRPNEAVIDKLKEIIPEDDDLEKKEKCVAVEETALITSKPPLETEQLTKKKVYSEIQKKGQVDWSIYMKYVVFGGGYFLMIVNILLFVTAQVLQSYSEKLLTKWVDQQQRVLDIQKNFTLIEGKRKNLGLDVLSIESVSGGTYQEALANEQFTFKIWTSIIFISIVLGLIKTYAIFSFFKTASINIHRAMIKNIMEAVMAFFDTHMIGNILNRFSQDLTNVDEYLVFMFMETLRVLLIITGIVTLISIVNIYFLIFAFACLLIMVLLRMLYIPAGRSLKRLDASTRSPMVGHLNASLEGLTTIRAYKAQSILIDEYDRHQDLYTSANYTSVVSLEAFGFGMDLTCTVLVTVVVAVFLFSDSGSSAGNVGLALGQVFMLSGIIQWGVKSWAELENLMTSVERLLEYTEIISEPQDGSEVEHWPSNGAITFEKVSLTYNNTETVLTNLNFKVEPRQKIGIVGRTGAGKSSIISSIFRTYNVDGKILIDDVNISTLSLKFLRKKLAIIPQDPILFTGTIRTNLDPFQEFKDDLLWKALEEVNLKNLITNLDLEVTNSGSNFSSGQKQLVCVARAILREAKIVILDEATANMDNETDALLHDTIKKSFAGCTVLTIAHRLRSILECDKVMVLDRGEIKEFDRPQKLLADGDGIFHQMVEDAGLLDQTKL